MHIAYISTEYTHPSCPPAGGIGSFVKLMGKSLVQQKHKVTIFLCLATEDKIWYDGDIRIVQINAFRTSMISTVQNRWHIAKRIKEHIAADAIHLVEAPDWEGMHAFFNFKIPLITRIHGSVTYFNHLQELPRPRLLYYLERRALRKSQRVVAVSSFSGTLTKDIFSLPDLQVTTLYNGIDVDAFAPGKKAQVNPLNILYFGTLVRKKGVVELAHIFKEVHILNPEARLTLVGKDTIDYKTQSSTWKVMQQILGPIAQKRVCYKGVIPYEQMKEEIAQATVCVFPSFAEAFPISWLEAMAMEKPIVASSIGWACESIENGRSGLLEHPSHNKEFALKIQSLLLDENKAKQLGIEARKRVEKHFDQSKLIQENIALYKSVCDYE